MVSSEDVRRCALAAAVVIAALWAPSTWATSTAANPRDTAALCERAVASQESAHRIPPKLLHAISLAESGRWDADRRENFAWPWTVTSGGEGQYYPTKKAAIRAVRALQRKGVRNIDVGCMQVNLHYHPDAFRSLDEAFDPMANARYAAAFLARLREDQRSWVRAVKHYHSATPALHGPYREKVYRLWRETRRRDQQEQYAERKRKHEQGQTVGNRILKMADRLLKDDRLDARAQLWLEDVAAAMIRNSGR